MSKMTALEHEVGDEVVEGGPLQGGQCAGGLQGDTKGPGSARNTFSFSFLIC